MELAEVMRSGLLGSASGTSLDTGERISLQGEDRAQRVRENDEETQREESSSTESTHQEVINTLMQTCKCGLHTLYFLPLTRSLISFFPKSALSLKSC